MKKILFVDDEPNVLNGLRRLLHPYREEWRMAFAAGGREALRLLEADSFDVLVTDVRMPGLSGAELLSKVSQQYPQMVRIVLSGMCDRDQALATAASAHQVLSKPCEAGELKKAVDRAVEVQATLDNAELKGFISRLKSLPSLPNVYRELMEAARNPEVEVRHLGSIISRDVAMTSKVLHLIGSSAFGLRRPILDPVEACIYLGVETIHSLVLSIGIFSQYHGRGTFSVQDLQAHSLRTAALVRRIAKSETLPRAASDEAFLAGMLHDVGKLVLAMNYGGNYEDSVREAMLSKMPETEVEQLVLGVNHATAGMYLLRLWGLPAAVTQAVEFHHQPSQAPEHVLSPLAIVHVADALDREDEQGHAGLDVTYLSSLGLDSKVAAWRSLRQEPREAAV